MGFNAVFFQVRPASDAFYPSKIFPWSGYLTGTQGIAPANGFDPLAFITGEAHKRGIELHAWINPYRITASANENAVLTPGHPARLHSAWTVTHSDGKMYWNPGEPGVRQLIADGVREIVDNYDVDGIHIDDYFYPGTDFADSESYSAYGADYPSVEEWRRANTEATVRDIRDVVKNCGKDISFGVSPVGIWANKSSSPLGSDTKGNEAYTQKFADTRGWVKREIIDYIAPQIYWNIGFAAAEYITLADWWADVTRDTGVKLYIGQAAYRSGNSDSASPWHGVSEIRRQMEYNRGRDEVDGYIMYSYASFMDNPELYRLMQEMNAAGNAAETEQDDARTDETHAGNISGDGANSLFTDISGHWAEAYINALAEQGIVKGNDDGRFAPDTQIKRADFVLMLTRMLGVESSNADPANFADVKADSYYAGALAAAREAELVNGVGDNMFFPESPLSRQDMFTMTWRAMTRQEIFAGVASSLGSGAGELDAFSDSGQIAAYAREPINALIALKITNGDNGLLKPMNNASRAEIAAIIYRISRIGQE
jgi:uncharacterized lipoprotein YddW (UPF0748 family)